MYDGVLVVTINSYYSKIPSTGTAVLSRSTAPTTGRGTWQGYFKKITTLTAVPHVVA